ncbi:hypothetical protein [Mangrovihabitans endophyticus]|uniref:Uncharacterized protein n=1 Tax=Mangrovihabitans endophyticus TaxID=1751298 RepID=A0A8J3FS08_9ACTN|nr:hypothetical protein [Mangrovihabitans endophyticus]GGL16076.1 hypothetical protein GCM10012284_58400 [Mangrovihabitans endophyticus]
MTPSYDRTELFLAPPTPQDTEGTNGTPPTIDHRAEAMRALCHPFAIRTQPAARPVR